MIDGARIERLRTALGDAVVVDTETASLDGGDSLPVFGPRDADAVAGTLRECAALGISLLVRGGGSKPGLVARARSRAGAVLSTARLDSIRLVDADDGVAHVDAGVRVSRLREAVEAAGWSLPLDPANRDATLGGVLASAETGPRLRGFGRPRDVVLGLGVTLGSGERTRCGGRVVKNVTGYDLAKLWTGSRGSLAVIEDAWLRLAPRPEATAVLLRPAVDVDDAMESARRARDLPFVRAVVIVEHELVARIAPGHPRSPAFDLALVLELAGPAAQLRELVSHALSGFVAPAAATLDPVHEWFDASARGPQLTLRFACAPSRASHVIEILRGAGATIVAHPEVALVVARFDGPGEIARSERVERAIRDATHRSAGNVRVDAAATDGATERMLRAALAPSAPAPRTAAILRDLSRRFDPRGVFAAAVPGLEFDAPDASERSESDRSDARQADAGGAER